MAADSRILVVGCGGTGSFVAEGLCRLLLKSDIPLILIDPDRVESHNLLRQQFFSGDVGKFKSQALAERLSRQYGRPIAYSVYPYMHDLLYKDYGGGLHSRANQGITVSCVDNAAARRSIAETWHLNPMSWWLDAGNGYSSGQVLIGNIANVAQVERSFDKEKQEVVALPIPTLQLPSLLAPPARPVTDVKDCAEAVLAEEQSPVINQAMATLVLEFMHRFLQGRLSWMGAYLDMEAGTLQTVPTEPEVVARMLGVRVDTLIVGKPEWRPTKSDINWVKELMATLPNGGKWVAPMGFTVIKNDERNIELIYDNDTPEVRETAHRTILIAQRLGIKVTIQCLG